MVIGTAIRILRQALGIKQNELAHAVGLSTAFLSLVESGDKNPSMATVLKIADALHVPPEALICFGAKSGSFVLPDEKAASLFSTLQRMMQMEDALRASLEKESPSGTTDIDGETYRHGYGAHN